MTFILSMLLFVSSIGSAAPKYPEAVIPDTVERSTVTIWSDGRALDGDIYRPKNVAADQKLPAIITSHGWGAIRIQPLVMRLCSLKKALLY